MAPAVARVLARIVIILAAFWRISGVSVFGQEHGLVFGLGTEVNGVSLVGPRLGASFHIESRLNAGFALGARGTVSLLNTPLVFDFGDPDYLMGFEAVVTPRFYLITPKTTRQFGFELFLEVDIGVLSVMRGFNGQNSRGSPEAGIAGGFRLLFGRLFYLEPFGRFGYPHIYGAGIMGGIRLHGKEPSESVRERVVEWERTVVKPLQYEVFVIMFAPDSDVFDGPGVDADLRAGNNRQLLRVIALLQEHPNARALIEGNANPVTGTQIEEEESLVPLSVRRAAAIVRIFEMYGISRNRLVMLGEGGSRPVVPLEDRENWRHNRRVEIRVLW